MRSEQLRLPRLRVRKAGPVSVVLFLKDVETVEPKVLMAQRPNGRWTFPGGKLKPKEYKNPARGGRREFLEETDIFIYTDEDLIEGYRSPIRVAVDRVERNIHFFYAFADESASTDIPKRMEPEKNGPWQYMPIRELPKLVIAGSLHELGAKTDMEIVATEAAYEAEHARTFEEKMRKVRKLQGRSEDSREYGFLEYIHDRDARRYAESISLEG
jgi:8-oxo-dGTP pyrophosphatase MutT (NUDIX family)